MISDLRCQRTLSMRTHERQALASEYGCNGDRRDGSGGDTGEPSERTESCSIMSCRESSEACKFAILGLNWFDSCYLA